MEYLGTELQMLHQALRVTESKLIGLPKITTLLPDMSNWQRRLADQTQYKGVLMQRVETYTSKTSNGVTSCMSRM